MKWKRRYTAEIPDPASWAIAEHRGGWTLYRALELVEGWRNYRLIHRRPAKTRVSFRIAWHPGERRFSSGRDHIYLACNHVELVYWIKDIASREPDQLALDADVPAREQTA